MVIPSKYEGSPEAQRRRCLFATSLWQLPENRRAGVYGRRPEGFFNAKELVVLRDAVHAGWGAGLDLAGVGGNGEVGDEGVAGLAAAVRDDRVEPGSVRHLDRVEGFGQRADLVEFDQDRVARLLLDSPCQTLSVGDEQIVADQLDLVPDLRSQGFPGFPVVLGESVFDRGDRVSSRSTPRR